MIAGGRRLTASFGQVGQLTAVRIVSLVAGFLANVLGARLLGASGMGSISTSLTVGSLGAVVASAGINLAAIYYLNREAAARPANSRALLSLGIVASLLAIGLVGASGLVLVAAGSDLGPPALLAAPLAAVLLWFDFGGSLLLGLGSERWYIATQAVEALTTLALTAVILLVLSATPAGYVLAAAAGATTAVSLALIRTRAQIGSLRPRFDPGFFRRAVGFGLRGQVGNLVQFLNLRLDLLLVPAIVGLAEAGRYFVAVRLSEAILLIATAGATLLFPRVAAQVDRQATLATEQLVRLTLVVIGGGAIALALFAEPVLGLLFGASFESAAWATRITAVAMLPLSIQRLLSSDLRGRGRPGVASLTAAIAVVVTIVGDVTLIPAFGIVGASVASLLAYSTGAVAVVVAFARETGAKPRRLLPGPTDVAAALVRLRTAATAPVGGPPPGSTPRPS